MGRVVRDMGRVRGMDREVRVDMGVSRGMEDK
jgi:hypothetical protein